MSPEPATEATSPLQRVLVVEDAKDARDTLQTMLKVALKLEVDAAADGSQALVMLGERPYSLIVTDLKMPKIDGMKLIQEIQGKKLPCTVIVTTGNGTIADAVEAMKLGAYDFLIKPPDPQRLILLAKRALRERRLHDEVLQLREQVHGNHTFLNVLSKSPKMHDVFELISQISDTSSTVLITGETGTGKEQVARAIHDASAEQRSGPFVPINCAAFNENLLESELFGHEKGSFTGAEKKRIGRFEQANGGTLFLDEIGDVPMPMQVKLLRVLQERRFERVGGGDPVDIDVRVVAATHQNMEKLIQEGKFREDLYFRLNVVRIDLPPLRERPEDIPVLVSHFCRKYARPGKPTPEVSDEAMAVLQASPWPGNVRQLENAIERACITTRDGKIEVQNLPKDMGASPAKRRTKLDLKRPLPELLAEFTASLEKRYLRKALRKTRGHVGKAAKLAGLSRRSVSDKIATYGIEKDDFKSP
ncbi:MAG: sigma-54 dependent transcriptional regulator [Gemmataceae bacterium]